MTVAVSGTSIGGVFHDRTPRRFDRLDLAVDGPVEPGPALVLPLRAADTVAGVLVALRSADEQPFSDKQLDMMAAFADQAALAWRLATAQRQMREVEILTDRDRTARVWFPVVGPPGVCTPTTSDIGRTVGPPSWPTWCWCARITTGHTIGA